MHPEISALIHSLTIIILLLCSSTVGCTPVQSTPLLGEVKPGPENTPKVTQQPKEHQVQEINVSPILSTDYLVNPGMGWQDGPERYGIMNFPETVAYANRREIAWSELHPAKGVFEWEPLDEQMRNAVEAGKQFSFRVYTVVGEGYDGNKVPEWVINEGARILSTGEPDYANCVYQAEWGDFINKLVRVYDGNPDIAFIDISGYGNFNEWSWNDQQTDWDYQWESDYANGTATPASITTIDGQARRRLVDMFIGGSFEGHLCRMPDGSTASVNYSYPGFQKTQLLMPYAGIVQSTQYVRFRRSDVGFRHDCLGREGEQLFEKIGDEILRTWKNAPVVFELCQPQEVEREDAIWLLQKTHGSIVHNNRWDYTVKELERMMIPAGYRYYLHQIHFQLNQRNFETKMEWQNLGLAPSYPKMGQEFQLFIFLVDGSGRTVFQERVPTEISNWLPADVYPEQAPGYQVSYWGQFPSALNAGRYMVGVNIVDVRTGKPIHLAFEGKNDNGIYLLFSIEIE